jgi:hypothetical protein
MWAAGVAQLESWLLLLQQQQLQIAELQHSLLRSKMSVTNAKAVGEFMQHFSKLSAEKDVIGCDVLSPELMDALMQGREAQCMA